MQPKQEPKQSGRGRIKQVYERLGRAAHTSARPLIKLYSRGKNVRVRVMILNEDGELLLVRSWFSHQQWSLPGGGIRSSEKPGEAAVREVFEETGLRIAIEDLHEVGSFTNPVPKREFGVVCFKVVIPKRPPRIAHHRRLEMLDVSWFPLTSLPKERSPIVDLAVAL